MESLPEEENCLLLNNFFKIPTIILEITWLHRKIISVQILRVEAATIRNYGGEETEPLALLRWNKYEYFIIRFCTPTSWV